MARRRRIPSSRRSGAGGTLATVVVMSALLVVLIVTQRGISTRLSEMFVDVTEGSAPPPPPEQTVRVAYQDAVPVVDVARFVVYRAVDAARAALEAP